MLFTVRIEGSPRNFKNDERTHYVHEKKHDYDIMSGQIHSFYTNSHEFYRNSMHEGFAEPGIHRTV